MRSESTDGARIGNGAHDDDAHHDVAGVVGGVGIIDPSGLLVSHDRGFAQEFGVDGTVHGALLPLVDARFGGDAAARVQASLGEPGATACAMSDSTRLLIGQLEGGRRTVTAEGPVTIAAVAGASDVRDDALRDPLTGLGNRRRLHRVLEAWSERAAPLPLALMMVDLDHFKRVNDAYGHTVGAERLVRAAGRITAATREDEEVIRLGGDEFVILHGGSTPLAVDAIAGRVVEFLQRSFLVDGHQIDIGSSIGIAVLHRGTHDADDLLRHADLALYEAKAAGRGTYRHFHPGLAQQAVERRDLETRMRRALMLGELSLRYQPQVRSGDGRVVGFEALLRWRNDVDGDVSPAVLIPLAEETGEIHAIGEWVLRQACQDAVDWPEALRVAVNVSPVQLGRAGFADLVSRTLAETGLPAERLEIELTEGVLFRATPVVLQELEAMTSLGVHVAIDDFGTGFSSLAQLGSFPFSAIKIDQSFLQGGPDERGWLLLKGIIALGKRIGMSTIAEGVETKVQADELIAEGCEELQGFLVGRPMRADRIAGFLAERGSLADGGGER